MEPSMCLFEMQAASALLFLVHNKNDRPRVWARVRGIVLAAGGHDTTRHAKAVR